MRKFLKSTSLIAVLAATAAHAQEDGNPGSGRAYAVAHCAECHAVQEATALSPNPDAPNFASVAVQPGMTGHALAVWLQTSHPTMPNFVIPPSDQDNIIAYILSLRKTAKP